MKHYDEQREIINYIWQFYRDLFTDAEKRAYMPYIWERMKVEKHRDVLDFEWKKNRIAEDTEVMALISDGVEAFHTKAALRVLQKHKDKLFLNRCPRCNRLVRTPKAQQCLWCSYDWHESASGQ